MLGQMNNQISPRGLFLTMEFRVQDVIDTCTQKQNWLQVFPQSKTLKIYSRNLQGLPTKSNIIPISFSLPYITIFCQLSMSLLTLMDQLQNTDNYLYPENIHCQNFIQTFIRTCCNQPKCSSSACKSRLVRTVLQSLLLLLLNQPCEVFMQKHEQRH